MNNNFSYPVAGYSHLISYFRPKYSDGHYEFANELGQGKISFKTIVNGLYISTLDLQLLPYQELILPNLATKEYCSLVFVLPGNTKSIKVSGIEEGSKTLEAGNVCIILPMSCINILIGNPIVVKLLFITFSTNWLNYLDEMNLRNEKFLHYFLSENEKFRNRKMSYSLSGLTEFLAGLDWNISFAEILAHAKIFEIFHHLLNYFCVSKKEGGTYINEKDLKKMQKMEAHLLQNWHLPNPSIKEAAELMYMSESKFKKLFKTVFGKSYYTYFLQIKLTHCMELLQSGKYSVAEVAYMAGYNSPSKFTEIFKRVYTIIPSSVIKEKRYRLKTVTS
jgi:AraC-like DNA-binding protein